MTVAAAAPGDISEFHTHLLCHLELIFLKIYNNYWTSKEGEEASHVIQLHILVNLLHGIS